MVILNFGLSVTATDFLWGRLRGQGEQAVGCHSSMHMCVDDASSAIMWAAPLNKLLKDYSFDYYQKKEQNKSP